MNQAYELPSFYLGVFPADVDLSTEANTQFHAVCIQAAVNVVGANGAALVLPGTIAYPPIGILQNNPAQGEAGTVMIHGVSKATAGGTITVGALLMANATGQLVVATTGNFAIAQALSAAVTGDIFSVLLIPHGKI